MKIDPKMDLQEFMAEVASINVEDQDAWDKAASNLRSVVSARRELSKEFDHVIRGAYNAHKVARSGKMQFDSELEKAEKLLRSKLSKFPAAPTDEFDIRKRVIFSVIDADAIPREYLCPDTKEIQRVVNSLGESTDIPGIEISLEYRVAVLGVPDED